MQLLTSIATAYRRWSAYGRLTNELSALSDRDLADIGIQRSEIRDLARRSAANIRAVPATETKAFTRIATAN